MSRISEIISSQVPVFIRESCGGNGKDNGGAFVAFLKYYYETLERTGSSIDILLNLLDYLDIDKIDTNVINGRTHLVEDLSSTSNTIVVESIDSFLLNNGTIRIGDEIITYESTTNSPNISFKPGVSWEQVKLKFIDLASIIDQFDGVTRVFPLVSQNTPVAPPSPCHLIVKVYDEYLMPGIDFTVNGTNIAFTEAPRTRVPADDDVSTTITYLNGFVENEILGLTDISGQFGDGKTIFSLTTGPISDPTSYEPVAQEYILAVYDGKQLIPGIDFFVNNDTIIFKTAPATGRILHMCAIEAPVPSFGSGAVGYAKIDDDGGITGVSVSNTGSGYRYDYPPAISVSSENGSGGSVTALINGLKDLSLLSGGLGYSDTNPPIVKIEAPTAPGSSIAQITATVVNGSVVNLNLDNSGSGYTFTPRITFQQPGGAQTPELTIVNGSIVNTTIAVTEGGSGYTTAPEVYIDEPTGVNGIRANLEAVIENGVVVQINVLNPGQGYETTPRTAIIDPAGAQVLDVQVDGTGRVISIELLTGGDGYLDVPSVYIIDNRENGGTGATAVASIFNGRITDINVTNFGTGYSADNPPTIVIQSPPQAVAAGSVGLNEVTGFNVDSPGEGYSKAQFLGAARGSSGITSFTEEGNARYTNNTIATAHSDESGVTCLDALFLEQILEKYKNQYLPNVPQLSYDKLNVRTAFKTIRDFYQAKGTSFSISYLFKLLYGETVSISYPKDQIIKPSAATWSTDTILRATLVSGNPDNIRDGLIEQIADIADPNVRNATALVENFISIRTSDTDIYELVLSEETINGSFTVPYKTKLAEPLDTTTSVITVDSTIGWPERNGEIVIGGTEIVRYKEKSLNQFIECTRSINDVVEDWDSATQVTSNFQVYINRGTSTEVIMNVLGIVDAQQTVLTDTGSYYLPGDKLSVSKLGGSGEQPQLTTWLYNVKKLIEVSGITFGGINNQSATVTCNNPHGLLVGDQVTVYGANPIIYNGTFLVTSRDSETIFQYRLDQPAVIEPQGNILISVDLNKGKSDNNAVNNSISPYTTNVQNSFFNDDYVYVASTGIPNYKIGPFPESALLPGNQRKLNRFPLAPTTISAKDEITPGPIGTWVNGVSIWSYKSSTAKLFGAVTGIDIITRGSDYDAANPPVISITGGGGVDAAASVIVDGSITEITVTEGGEGYTSSPLVSIVGGNGSGAAATAIVTKGRLSRILINSGGTGYTTKPTITIVGGGGIGATAEAVVRGPIKEVNIDNGGESYIALPQITLSSGSGAVAQPIVNTDGRIISVAIIDGGSGYTSAPEVAVSGVGFGAVLRAQIATDGEEAGTVTGIEIVNRGIGYDQGTTSLALTSIGEGATFAPKVFEWTYNLQESTSFDAPFGSVFQGFNTQYGGEYAHLSNPQKLRFILGDNLYENTSGQILEQESSIEHSPIIGWAFDGNPIYGPYGFQDPTDQGSSIIRLGSSYQLKSNLVYDEVTNPVPVRIAGPLLTEEPAGTFVEDYVYTFGLGDLDQYNGRFCKTPDFPEGRYCYFVTIDAAEQGNAIFPYVLGPSYNSVIDKWNISPDAVQQNIPTGVIRYRDPYENVDIDVERNPNASTNGLTLENGDLLLFEVEDENRDGLITQDEIDDPDQIFEEPPLQLYDYFPVVKFDSKVDIEVDTITKFKDASVTSFNIENPGRNYQVNDRLVFDDQDTDGSGVSARISKIKGETVSSYSFENISGNSFGVLQTDVPHNLVIGDKVFVDYTPTMDNTNKEFVVRQYRGIEEIVINQTGSGYNEDIPPTIIIDGDGVGGELQAHVDSVGAISIVNIINSGTNYTSNPRVILSHPQIFKKADYYIAPVRSNDFVVINDTFVTEDKSSYICGVTKKSDGTEVAFVAKLSATGVKQWEKTLESIDGLDYAEFKNINVYENQIWVSGIVNSNVLVLDAYNPDIILCKYTESIDGLSATLSFQKAYAGISGSTREDVPTVLKRYSDNRVILAGYTNTNSSVPYDAFLSTIDAEGNFSIKRKIATSNRSEKLIDVVVSGTNIYFTLELSNTSTPNTINLGLGKATVGATSITIDWVKEYTLSGFSLVNPSIVIDEFNELYMVAGSFVTSNPSNKDSIFVVKSNTDGDVIWSKRFLEDTRFESLEVVGNSKIDIFGDLRVAYNCVDTDNDNQKVTKVLEIDYKGNNKSHYSISLDGNRSNPIEGWDVNALSTDVSGDTFVVGHSYKNQNEFIFDFAQTDSATDKTGHYTPTLIGNDATDSLTLLGDGVAKLFGKDVATPANWENAAVKILGTELSGKLDEEWTLEFMLYHDSANSDTHGQTQQTLVSIGDATDTTGGLWLYYDRTQSGPSGPLELIVTSNGTTINSTSSGATSVSTSLFADDTWQFVSLRRSGSTFTVYINGIQQITGTVGNVTLANKDLYIGNIPGRDGTAGTFRSNEQGQYYIDNLRLRSEAIAVTVPSDVLTIPTNGAFGLTYDWSDDAWFTGYLEKYSYISDDGLAGKFARLNGSTTMIGSGSAANSNLVVQVTSFSNITPTNAVFTITGVELGDIGLQTLDYDDADAGLTQDPITMSFVSDIIGSRTATVPSPGSQKLIATAVVKDRYFFKVTNTLKIDNVQELTLNQSANFTPGTNLVLSDADGLFINSGYIISVDVENKKVYTAVNNNAWSDDLNTGELATAQFNELSTYGIQGQIPDDVNEIERFTFPEIAATTSGVFDIDLATYDNPEGGTNNLDEFAKFKPWEDGLYSVRIDEVSTSEFIVGSVVSVGSSDVSFNAEYSTIQIGTLTGVEKITLITNLKKIVQVTSAANSDTVYVITDTKHYLNAGEIILIDGNPSEEIGGIVYDEYDGAFPVDSIVSPLEFTYKLNQVAVTSPATSASSVNIFVKSPTLKMYYGHQYLFDLSHSSMLGGNLSFSKDNLYKLEYSFNSINRVGTPGITGEGQPTPTVILKVDREVVTNISYYFDPSRPGENSPVIAGSYLDVVNSPYVGEFTISSTAGATITTGADTFKFPLINEPEGAAEVANTTYSTSSQKAVGSISDIRIVNPGGFYTKLPVVSGIESSRQIERVQINDPGTEYAVGEYTGIPISGDGEGGLVTITVADGTDDEGITVPGQIQSVVVTSPGKGYTTATIDLESIDGILGAGLTGSGADLQVVIPPFGSDASIFTKGTNVGKIKNLKNNNFGYDYPHDYTLRPEITFPINAQLTSTSILDSITVTDPGSGYSQAPAVVITGGGGSGAVAEALVRNGRLDQILVKDPGAGYSSEPAVELKSSFNYVINLDLGLLQFAFPHGIVNGAEVTLNVVDTGDGADFPVAAGAIGRLNGNTTYYAISGNANSLDDDQLRLAITQENAELGDYITFSNTGEGRQQVLTSSFGGAAQANVVTSTFLQGEQVYQGDSIENATATGFISTNNGWQIGPRIVKIVDYSGTFNIGQRITGVVSKSSGLISDISIAKGVLEIGSITRTTGQFIDDVGKPSEIIQKIQDSYYYQDFSYAIKSSVSIEEWKQILYNNVHPASFKIFGELSFNEYAFVPNKETAFQLTKSVQLAQEAVVPNIQSFALVEPIYSEFNNTEVLFRQKRLTSSENILTSVVQRLDDISNLFDGERIAFPLTVDGSTVVANQNQLMIILNGVVQNPGLAFTIQGDSVVFSEPPQPPASVKYVDIEFEEIATVRFTFDNISGIFPLVGNTLLGTESQARLTVTSVEGNDVLGYITQGTFIPGELTTVSATGFNANYNSSTAVTTTGLFIFGEQITNFSGDTAKVEVINLATEGEGAQGQLRYSIGTSTTSFEVIGVDGTEIEAGIFVVGEKYQMAAEVFEVTEISVGEESTTLTVIRGQDATSAGPQQENTPIYRTNIALNTELTLSKTAGTYQSTPGLFSIDLDDIIISAQSGIVARVVSANVYSDPFTGAEVPQVNISDGSSFFGLLFNRIASTTYPNVVLDNIAASTVNLVRYDDNTTAFNNNFPANEQISNYILPYDNETGDFQDGESIRNYKLEYGSASGEFVAGEPAVVRKLSFRDISGTGFFGIGQVVRTLDTKAEILGFDQANATLYLGKIGRCLSTGEDVHSVTFNNEAELDSAQSKFGNTSLELSAATTDYISVGSSTEFGWGTAAYTVECYVRATTTGLTGSTTLIDFRDDLSDNSHGVLYLSAGQIRYDVGGVNIVNSGLVALNNDTWYHVAIQRSSTGTNGVSLLIDGAQAAQGTDATNYPSRGVRVGANAGAAQPFDGHIDELRLSGSSRYSTIPFVPQPGIFQGDANSKLLLHFDGADTQRYDYDWSGGESFTVGEDFNNDAILATTTANSGNAVSGFDGKTHRYYDAGDLITANRDYIANEVVYLLKKKFPYFTVPGGEIACEDDIRDILDALIQDIRSGSNSNIWDASALYVDRTVNPVTLNHVEPEIRETIFAYDKLKEILKYIVNNELWSTKGDHGLTQFTDVTITDSSTNTFTQLTPTNATYDPATGDMVVTVSGHGLVGPTTHTPTAANYAPSTGIMTLTVNNHGFVAGDKIQINENALTFTCAMDGYTAQKTYPRSNDPGALGWLEITNITTNTFDVNVGESLLEYYTVTALDYDPTNNKAVLTIGDHELRPGTSIKLQNESLTLTCATDSHGSEHSYPRSGDGNYDTAIEIVNNGSSHTPTNVSYNPQDGETVFTIADHGWAVGDKIRIEDNSLTFTCSQDDNNSEHTYPRSTDPASGRWLRITAVTTDTFTVNTGDAGTAKQYDHTFVSAAANAITYRDGTITINLPATTDVSDHIFIRDELIGGNGAVVAGGNYAHAFVSSQADSLILKGDSITFADESIVFTCTSDNNERQLAHPRSFNDRPYRAVLDLKSHTSNTFTLDVGESAPDAQFAHTFVSAETNAITVVDYNTLDCADVYATTSNLVEILTDTLREANSPNNTADGDHLATITKVSPAYEFVGGTVDAFYEVGFNVDYHDTNNDIVYSNQIDSDGRYRFKDAAGLIRANRKVIVDKTSADLLTKYPDLAQDMPLNENGGSTAGTDRCKTDLGLLLDAVANDIENDGNENIVDATRFYLGTNDVLVQIRFQVHQSVYAHERLGYYMKQAINGDLTYDNTDGIIVGDWGITDDPGECADVQNAIDTLITTLNDILAPTGSDYAVAADRLYFNRQYIAEESTGLTTNQFTYDLNGVTYSAFVYPEGTNGEIKCQRDLKLILLSIISDLQTGGSNSTIDAIESYLTATGAIDHVESELLATVYAIEQLKFLGEKALDNRLYEFNSGFTDPDYSAVYTDEQPYRDSEVTTNISEVISRYKELVDIAVKMLSPGGEPSRNAGELILYNENYYSEQITQLVNTQFGTNSWQYDTFLETVVNDTVHDLVTTDINDKSLAYAIDFSSVTSEEIAVGSALYLPGTPNSYALVYEYDSVNETAVVGTISDTLWVAGNTISSYDESGWSGVINTITAFDWYNSPSNLRTIEHAKTILSDVSGELSSLNLYTNPENFNTAAWSQNNISSISTLVDGPEAGDYATAYQVTPDSTAGQHYIERNYNLASFETFDTDTDTFDTDTTRFDEGPTNQTLDQTLTASVFVRSDNAPSIRFEIRLDNGSQRLFFDTNLVDGSVGSLFIPAGGATGVYGAIPYGNGWYRLFISATFAYGFNSLQSRVYFKNSSGSIDYSTGIVPSSVYGAKLNKGGIDAYTSVLGQVFYSNAQYNIQKFALDTLEEYMYAALKNQLVSPAAESGFYEYENTTATTKFDFLSIQRVVKENINIIRQQILTGSYYTQVTAYNGITIPTRTYGTRNKPVGIAGGVNEAEYFYGTYSDRYAEVNTLSVNEGYIAKVYKRFRIDGDITDGPYTMNETVAKQGAPSITGIVYGFSQDENFKYLDVEVTAGPWAITDTVIGAENSTSAQISGIENRLQIIDLSGEFIADIPFKGYTGGYTATPTTFLKNQASVTENTGGVLNVDTATLLGSFEVTSVVYPEISRQYIDVTRFGGLPLQVGSRIASAGHIRLNVAVSSGLEDFTVGNFVYKLVGGIQDQNNYGIITELDLDNNFIYVAPVLGSFANNDSIGDYGLAGSFPVGQAIILTATTVSGAGSAIIQDIRDVGINKRLYLTDIVGTFNLTDYIIGSNDHKSIVLAKQDLVARVKRSSRGFDGVQSTFDLTIDNGTTYLPDPEGHMLIFINGILQPPGATNAFTAFSNQIQFNEAPELGASFTGFYLGKLRQLDDISFEFDSLRQSFNLKRDEVFYSLTLTEGTQSSTIRPENNIIVSLNGVVQEPGVGFEIVGSRIIFSEIPRVGSTFVAFSYVGSEADVDAAVVVPPVEVGDLIDIEGETEDREVAVIESSNSLITFDYLGSVFGQGAIAQAALTTGYIDEVTVTAGGSGYIARPVVKLESISGFDGQIRALVGVAGIEMNTAGSGYQNPEIEVETSVPDDWTAPNLADYGEELIDPEVLP